LIQPPGPAQLTTGDPPVVQTEGGPVTLADLAMLRAKLSALQEQARSLAENAASLRALAKERLVDLGSTLLDSPQWQPPDDIKPLATQVQDLRSRLNDESSQLSSIRTQERHGVGGLIGKVGGWNQSRKLTSEISTHQGLISDLLMKLGQQVAVVPEGQPSSLLEQAHSAGEQATDLDAQAASITTLARTLDEEIHRRAESQAQMGFDAPYLTAYLKTYGPPPVASPLNLKRSERALAVVGARLARQQTRTHYVGGSQGFSFPIGHTGIRYRVGSYHGHPVQQQYLATLDTGSLVITDQRIAFIGPLKATSVAFSKVLHVECYADALAVFEEGRENPNFYLTTQPKYVLFMINWAVT
jgi:hypothetical protein